MVVWDAWVVWDICRHVRFLVERVILRSVDYIGIRVKWDQYAWVMKGKTSLLFRKKGRNSH